MAITTSALHFSGLFLRLAGVVHHCRIREVKDLPPGLQRGHFPIQIETGAALSHDISVWLTYDDRAVVFLWHFTLSMGLIDRIPKRGVLTPQPPLTVALESQMLR